jgi:hypothetical protein
MKFLHDVKKKLNNIHALFTCTFHQQRQPVLYCIDITAPFALARTLRITTIPDYQIISEPTGTKPAWMKAKLIISDHHHKSSVQVHCAPDCSF